MAIGLKLLCYYNHGISSLALGIEIAMVHPGLDSIHCILHVSTLARLTTAGLQCHFLFFHSRSTRMKLRLMTAFLLYMLHDEIDNTTVFDVIHMS